jgi:hypothetical protein
VHLLYLDESGNPNDPADRHFILAGVCVFERVTYFVSEDMERLQSALFPDTEPLEFHANEIRAGKGFWRSRQPDERQAALDGLRDVILKAHKPGLRLFAAVVQKRADCYGDEAVKRATEIMCQSFDHHLKQCYQVKKDPQRGLLVVAQSRFDDRSKLWVRDFRKLGTQWGTIDNLADTPLFASTKDSRLLQLADYVSHAAYRMYERGDTSWLDPVLGRFYKTGNVLAGFVHDTPDAATCGCPACLSRRSPSAMQNTSRANPADGFGH